MKTARLFAAITAIAGGVLLAASILISNTTLEQAFGRAPHSLAWGTTLFRILLALHGLFCSSCRVCLPRRPPHRLASDPGPQPRHPDRTHGGGYCAAHSGPELLHVAG